MSFFVTSCFVNLRVFIGKKIDFCFMISSGQTLPFVFLHVVYKVYVLSPERLFFYSN